MYQYSVLLRLTNLLSNVFADFSKVNANAFQKDYIIIVSPNGYFIPFGHTYTVKVGGRVMVFKSYYSDSKVILNSSSMFSGNLETLWIL